jgi:anti-sigma factor RsiW
MMDECLSDNDIAAFVDGKVWPEERPRMEGHLARCAKCRDIVVFVFRMNEMFPPPNASNSSVH